MATPLFMAPVFLRDVCTISDPDPHSGEHRRLTKIEKSKEISCFEVLDVLFWGLKASPVAWKSFMEA